MCVLVLLRFSLQPGFCVELFGLALPLAGQRLQVQGAQPVGPAELPAPSVLRWSSAGEQHGRVRKPHV